MRKIVGTILVISLVIALTSIGDAKDKKYPLKATIESDKKVYKVGEPVKIEFRLENVETKKICVYTEWEPRVLVWFEITKDGAELPIAGPYLDQLISPRIDDFATLAPSSFVGHIYNINKDFKVPLFEPGQYTIQFFYHNLVKECPKFGIKNVWTGELQSNQIVIEIVGEKKSKISPEWQKKIDKWAKELKGKNASKVLHDIGVFYGYERLRGTKIVPILIETIKPCIIDGHICAKSEGKGEYIGQVIETLGQIGDERAIPILKKVDQPIADSSIKEILEADFLTVIIKSDKKIYEVGEDIVINFTLINANNEKAVIVDRNWFDPGKYSLIIYNSKGEKFRPIYCDSTPQPLKDFFTLAPKESFSDQLKITKNPNQKTNIKMRMKITEWDYRIFSPDIYTIVATYENYTTRVYDTNVKKYTYIDAWIGTTKSNTVTVTVKSAKK